MAYQPHWLDRMTHPVSRLLGRRRFMPLNRLILEFAYRINGFGISSPAHDGGLPRHEAKAVQALLQRLRPRLVLDVGAHVGDFAALVRRISPTTQVVCFEPQPKAYEAACRRLMPDGVVIERRALSDFTGDAELFDALGTAPTPVASLSKDSVSALHDRVQSFPVSVDTLDSFCRRHGIIEIGLLKIDTEGNDLRVMRGAHEMLAAGAINAITFELIPACIDTHATLKEIFAVLAGFDIHRVLADGSLYLLSPYQYKFMEVYVPSSYVAIRRGLT